MSTLLIDFPPRPDAIPYASARCRHLIRDLPPGERPLSRFRQYGAKGVSTAELLALVTGAPDGLDLAGEMLAWLRSVSALSRVHPGEMMRFDGVGEATAVRLLAAVELGRRVITTSHNERTRITSRADAAALLMPDMCHLEQEHLRVVLLDTRNQVIETTTIYIGSLNTAVVRIGEIFKAAIRVNAAAIIVCHNHPSGCPSPSPEDIRVTREIVKAGEMLSIRVLDHLIIGDQRFVSLKERGLGFDG